MNASPTPGVVTFNATFTGFSEWHAMWTELVVTLQREASRGNSGCFRPRVHVAIPATLRLLRPCNTSHVTVLHFPEVIA